MMCINIMGMKSQMIGALIRKERIQRNWSLAGLAKDICAMSYLSKIEQGKAECSDDILKLLFAKLSIDWHDDTSFIEQGELFTRCVYESIFTMEEIVFSDDEVQLMDAMENSRFVVDALLFKSWKQEMVLDGLRELRRYMDERQLCLLYLLEEKYDEALHIFPCALTYYYAGMDGYVRGNNYELAMQRLQKAYSLAGDEGSVLIMLQSAMLLGNLSGNLLDVNTMLHQYAIAQRLARVLHAEEDLRVMQYNKAAVLIEAGRAEEAYQYFKTLDDLSLMERHKYAIASELTGRKDEAMALLEGHEEEGDELSTKMVELVERRLINPEYLDDETYGKLLLEVFEKCQKDLPIGYAAFHLPWVVQWYVHHRQYRAAFELTTNFPIKVPLLELNG